MKGAKRTQNIPYEEHPYITWSSLLSKVSVDSERVRLIVNGSIVPDTSSRIAELRGRPSRLNVLIIPNGDYNPSMCTLQASLSTSTPHEPPQVTSGNSSDSSIQPEHVVERGHDVKEIEIGSKSQDSHHRVVNVNFGIQKFRVTCFGVDVTLKSLAETIASDLGVIGTDLVFLSGGRKYYADSSDINIRDWPHDSTVIVMFNQNYWESDTQRKWLEEQLHILERLRMGVRETVGRAKLESNISAVSISWKRKLEELEQNIINYCINPLDEGSAKILKDIQIGIQQLKHDLA